MKLIKMELTNYRQHKRMDVDFSGNLIAVLGQNGSGKSNFLGAIQFALTGEQPPFQKKDLARWGSEMGSVRLTFEANAAGDRFVIVRKTDGSATMKCAGETVTGAKKVEEALARLAGIDKDLLKQIVFVPQAGVDAILFDDPKNREVSFQKLIGIGSATKIWTDLGAVISDMDRPQGFDEAITAAEQRLGALKASALESKAALDKYAGVLPTLPTRERLDAETEKANAVISAVGELKRAVAAQVAAAGGLEAAKGALSDAGGGTQDDEIRLRKELTDITEAGSSASGERQKLRSREMELQTAERYLDRLSALVDAVKSARAKAKESRDAADAAEARWNESCGPFEAQSEAAEDAKSELRSLEMERSNLCKLSGATSGNGECPLCGNPTTPEEMHRHVEDRLAEIDALLAQKRPESAELSRRLAERKGESDAAASVAASADGALERASEELGGAAGKGVEGMEGMEGVEIDASVPSASFNGHSTDDIGAVRGLLAGVRAEMEKAEAESREREARVRAVNSELSRMQAAAEATARKRDAVSDAEAKVKVAAERQAAALERLLSLGVEIEGAPDFGKLEPEAESRLKMASGNRTALDGLMTDMAAERGRAEANEKAIGMAECDLEELKGKKSADDAVRARVDKLKAVREWFHFRKGPRKYSRSVMDGLTESVNGLLGQFSAPFEVVSEEDGFGFMCRFTDGREMPDPLPDASLLSGGQKVMLAVAFRMAIYMAFGARLGLLSLDEPTAYLDDANIGRFGDLLSRVGQVARNSGLQVLMATHEKAIMPYMDTRIELGDGNEGNEGNEGNGGLK